MEKFEYLVPDFGEMEENDMKMNMLETLYTDEDLELGETVADFLPSPEELANAERRVKITIALSSESLEYFQKAAQHYGMPYQKMIRRVLDEYVMAQKRKVRQPRPVAAD